MKEYPVPNSLVGFVIICLFLEIILQLRVPRITEIKESITNSQISDMQKRSWSEEDREDWVILSKTELVSGLHLRKVYARRVSDNFVHSIFTEKEYSINARVKVAWIHHRVSHSTRQNVELPIILMQCN